MADSAGPTDGVIDTRINWTLRTNWLTYGTTTLLEGQVVAYVESEQPDVKYTKPLKDAPVELFARPVGSSTWKHVATRRTDSETVFRFDTHKPVRNTDYKIAYRGDLIYAASDATTRVNVQRVISSSMSTNSDGTYTMRGTVAPKMAGKTVRLQRKTCSTCSWSTLKSTSTTSTSRWSFRVTRPTSSGTWYYRAYTPKDSHFLTSYSGTWSVRRGQTVVAAAVDGALAGLIGIADAVKDDAADAVARMKDAGLTPVMITGDNERTARAVAAEVGIEQVRAEVLPEDKAEQVRQLQEQGLRVAMVGDGINDAPALTQADVGIAIGAGTDIAIESADIVITSGRLGSVLDAYQTGRKSYAKTKQNLALAFAFNGIGVPAATTGLVHPAWAMAAMVGSVTAVLVNSFAGRLLRRTN